MLVHERFLKYVSFDTQSDENSTTVPSYSKQKMEAMNLWCSGYTVRFRV